VLNGLTQQGSILSLLVFIVGLDKVRRRITHMWWVACWCKKLKLNKKDGDHI